MAGAGLEVDISRVLSMFKELNDKDFKKAQRQAVRQGASILKRATDRAYRSQTKISRRTINSKWKFKPGRAVVSYDNRTGLCKVHIMADYMMKWFELGTSSRLLRNPRTMLVIRKGKTAIIKKKYGRFKPRIVGSIEGKFLFRHAQLSTQNKIFSEMSLRLEKAIKKINDKKR